ncbi:GlxA family transcriptional regulator [Leifsonia sp. AG29]|uniref:GlxA family transcriptional regulator n=1 Tax=Leifsonia sp. AG29 TaxID=2598860 RepID=UPI00131E780F|nr:helix-turn-helix domain-containing protein [Leifsonia sp. AG29]
MLDRQVPHRVCVLVLEGVLPLDLGIPLQVFAERPEYPYRLSVCGPRPGVIPAESGIGIAVAAGLEALDDADTVIVPGYKPPTAPLAPVVAAALSRAHDRGARIVGICYGAFALAGAGLLDGRRATTHWDAAGVLARVHPRVEVDEGVLYVDQGQVLTSAGVAAGLDLCLYMVRKDLGAKAANDIARRLVTAPRRPGGQSQYVPTASPVEIADASLDPVKAWAREHLAERLTLPQLAARANLSTRTFERRFIKETGTTPHRWLQRVRLDEARALLEDSELSVDQIADRVGLGSGSNLRLQFRSSFGTTPTAYRRTFTTALRAAEPGMTSLA